MLIKSIVLKNIRSYEDQRIEFAEGSILLSGDIGSGKSSILMAVYFALFGIRKQDISSSEILRHGSNDGFVELEIDIGGKKIEIKRMLKRSKTGIVQKSGMLSINNMPMELMPTEINARIFELLGYPKDMATKGDNIFTYSVYTPQEEMKHILLYPEKRLRTLRKIFDVDKYDIIRDNASLLISEFNAMKREAAAQSKDIDELSERIKSEKQETEALLIVLNKSSKELSFLESAMEEKRVQKELIKKELEKISALKQLLAGKKSELNAKLSRQSQIANDIDVNSRRIFQFEEALARIVAVQPEKTEEQIKTSIKEKEKALSEKISSAAVCRQELARLKPILEKGLCTVCGQKVHEPEEFRSKIADIQNQLSTISSESPLISKQAELLKKELEQWTAFRIMLEKRRSAENNIGQITEHTNKMKKEASELTERIHILEKEISNINIDETAESKSKIIEDEIYKLQKAVMTASNIKTRLEQQIEDSNKRIKDIESHIQKKRELKKQAERLDSVASWLSSFFAPLTEIIEKHVMLVMQKEFSMYFQEWFSMLMSDMTVRINDTFSPIIEQNGYETDYINLSGGEKTSVALAYRLALNKVINKMIDTIKTKDIIILDEPTDGFSSDQLDRVRDVLKQLAMKQTIIVSHEPKIDAFVENVIRIYKDNHLSRAEKG